MKKINFLFFFAVLFLLLNQCEAGINLIYGYDPKTRLSFKESGLSGSYLVDGAMFQGIEYQIPLLDQLDYSVGFQTFSVRNASSVFYNSSNTTLINTNFKYSLLYANLIYKVWGPLSLYWGINYPIFVDYQKGSNGPDANLSGGLGYQAGIAVNPLEHLQFEITGIQQVSFSGKNNSTGQAISDGTLKDTVGGTFTIQLKLVNLNKLFNLF